MMIRPLAFSFILAMPGLATTAESQQTAEPRAYVNPVYAWSFSYPRDWALDSNDPAFVKIQPPASLPEGLVGIHSLTHQFKSLDELVDAWLASYAAALSQRGTKLETLSRQNISLPDGTPAVEVVSLLGSGVVGKSRKVFVLLGSQGFLIDAETHADAWEELGPYFDRMVSSFSMTDAARTGAPTVPAPPRAQQPAWERYMEEARRDAAAGKEQILEVEGKGVFVFYNNPRPFCYTYMIPGDWVPGEEWGIYNSKDGRALVGVLFLRSSDLRKLKGATLVERAQNLITQQHEKGVGQKLSDVEVVPFESARPGTWKWTAAPVSKGERRIGFPTKIIVDLGSDAVALITITGTPDDESLARHVLETLETTADPECYWSVLEQVVRTTGG